MKRRSFLMSMVALPALQLSLLSLKAANGRSVVDGASLGDIVSGWRFENVHFSTPINALLIRDCEFVNCTAETAMIHARQGLRIESCKSENSDTIIEFQWFDEQRATPPVVTKIDTVSQNSPLVGEMR